ncbi:baseplate J/gp47 family protein [Bradyrhizobium erythrophlei]|uniref:baseplate J/gp47 family protein n=1 Tax=Bradyrhizobium erythrophlei TaxID=1437360 RepID=UPI00156005DA|nr:baseplate J/gp47 family protein [Bradyrhizobium erythrophlei]
MAAGIQGRAAKLLNFSTGSTLRAIAEGFAGLFLWFQALVIQLLSAIRLSTSSGNDVDTWCADFMPVVPGTNSPRLPAQASTGVVTFSRFTAAPTSRFIAVGATLQTDDGSENFVVTANTTYATYSAALNGYTLAANVGSITVPVQCATPGSGGNVAAGTITVITTPITGIDTVTNGAAFINGFDSESDAALKARFVLYIASLRAGTEGAIGYAIVSIRQGMQYQIWEPGTGGYTQLTVFVDDGSGAIPTATLTAAQVAAFGVKAAGPPMAVLAATEISANLTMTITTAPGYDHPTAVAQVYAAITNYINGIGLGTTPAAGTLSYGKLYQIAFNASPGVTDVTGYTLNGVLADLVPGAGQTIKSGSVVVS